MAVIKEIDDAYDARASVLSFETEYAKLVALSREAQATLPVESDLDFGAASGAKLDIYGAAEGRPIFLWIHGGYWRFGTKEDNAFAATGLARNGIAVAVMDYALAPRVKLATIVAEVRQAVRWLYQSGSALGLDVRKIHVGGSSAGGHLAGMLLTDDWTKAHDLPETVIGATLALSGIYDLEPLLHTKVNNWMDMDWQTVETLSPLRHIPKRTTARLILSVGGLEPQGFLQETAQFGAAWRAARHTAQVIEMPHHNHFDLSGTLADPNGKLVQVIRSAIYDA